MDRLTAARELGVPPGASARRLTKAYRARVRSTHPDRFPPGSEAWEDANRALVRLNEAMGVLTATAAGTGPATGVPAAPAPRAAYRPAPAWERRPEGFRSPRDSDRLARSWGYWWGSFLLVSAVVGAVVGARAASNDALPLWSPGLAVIGGVALVIGWRADRRLRR